MHSAMFLDLRHDFFRVCVVIALSSLLANFLPAAERIKPSCWRTVYVVLVDIVAGFALNWRVRLPSLDQEFLGFRRSVRHGFRNWRESRRCKRLRR